jgi:hypothetical protein
MAKQTLYWIQSGDSIYFTEPHRISLKLDLPNLEIKCYEDAQSGYDAVKQRCPDIVIIDPWINPGSESKDFELVNRTYGEVSSDLVDKIRASAPKLPIILFSYHGNNPTFYTSKGHTDIITSEKVMRSLKSLTDMVAKYIQK